MLLLPLLLDELGIAALDEQLGRLHFLAGLGRDL
jgi:hypothetical protein